MPPEEKRRLCVAALSLWKKYKQCHTLGLPSGLVFAYKANAIVDRNEVGTARRDGTWSCRMPLLTMLLWSS